MLDDWNAEIETGLAPSIAGGPVQLFGLDNRAEFLSRGRGHVVAFAACNDRLFIATSRNFVLRHDLSDDGSSGECQPWPANSQRTA